jgi:hypothetical protein
MRLKPDKLKGYKALSWPADSKLSQDEQEAVELQRRDLWRHGIKKEPMLTQLAFEFGAVLCMMKRA